MVLLSCVFISGRVWSDLSNINGDDLPVGLKIAKMLHHGIRKESDFVDARNYNALEAHLTEAPRSFHVFGCTCANIVKGVIWN